MNKQIFGGQWRETKAQLKQQWHKLTDEDLATIKDNHEEIYGMLQKYYGYAKDEAKEVVEEFVDNLPSLNAIAQFAQNAWSLLKEKVRENPVKSFFIALSAIAVLRRIRKHAHH